MGWIAHDLQKLMPLCGLEINPHMSAKKHCTVCWLPAWCPPHRAAVRLCGTGSGSLELLPAQQQQDKEQKQTRKAVFAEQDGNPAHEPRRALCFLH